MFKLDNAFLEELGLGSLPAIEKNKMLAHIYETLEMRVGMRLAEQMSNDQLDEFESYINRQDEAGALKWLETNFPNYKQVVAEELEKLKVEIKQVAPQIVAQAQAATAQTLASVPPPVSPAVAQQIQPAASAAPGQAQAQPGYQTQQTQFPLPQATSQPSATQNVQQPVQPLASPGYPQPQQPLDQPRVTAQPAADDPSASPMSYQQHPQQQMPDSSPQAQNPQY